MGTPYVGARPLYAEGIFGSAAPVARMYVPGPGHESGPPVAGRQSRAIGAARRGSCRGGRGSTDQSEVHDRRYAEAACSLQAPRGRRAFVRRPAQGGPARKIELHHEPATRQISSSVAGAPVSRLVARMFERGQSRRSPNVRFEGKADVVVRPREAKGQERP